MRTVRKSWVPSLLVLSIAVLVALASYKKWFESLEYVIYDALVKAHTLTINPDIIIVEIDDASLSELGAWPWDRRLHANLLAGLDQTKLVIFDVLFSEPQSELLLNKKNALFSSDQLFIQAVAQHEKTIFPVYIQEQAGLGLLAAVLPMPGLAKHAASLGHVQLYFDNDGLVRTVEMNLQDSTARWQHLMLAGLSYLKDQQKKQDQHDAYAYLNNANDWGARYVRFVGAAGSVPRISFSDVLANKVSPDLLQEKIVIVGATAFGLGDYISTPMGYMSGVEFNANVMHAIQQQGFIRPITDNINSALLVVAFIVFGFLVVKLTPQLFLTMSVVAGCTALLLELVLFWTFGIWLSVLPFVAGVMVLYPLWSWRRIEIALGFLQDELSHLSGTTEHGQVGQEKKIVDPSSIEKNLQSLGTASLIYDWEFSKLKGQKEDCWPRHKLTATGQESFFYTVIPCQSHYYNLSFFSRLDQPVIYGLVTDLLALQKEEQKKLDDSVELVEATIEKIKHARQEVDRLQMRMNRSMAFLQDAVVLTDLSGRILFINLVASNWFSGLEENDSIVEIQNFFGGKSWLGLVHKLLSTYAPIYQELLLLSDHAGDAEKNKTLLCQAAKLDVDTSSSAVQTHFLLVFTDVSQLREAERSKRETLAFLSHDMRSPIVSQLATITSLREDNTLDKGFDQVLDKLEHYGLRSLKYSEDFLQLSRAESIKKQQFYLVDMHGVIDAAVTEHQGIAMHKQIALLTERDNEDAWVEGDTQLLERALSNLVGNAIEYSPVNSEVRVSLQLAGGELVVSIRDQGPGMDQNSINRLLSDQYKKSTARSEKTVGRSRYGAKSYGLGLSFVYTVINRHGGRIIIQSEPDIGTEFKLYFSKIDP